MKTCWSRRHPDTRSALATKTQHADD
jgi:hypothetical protein